MTGIRVVDNRGKRREYHERPKIFCMQRGNHETYQCLLSQKIPVHAKGLSEVFILFILMDNS